MTSFTVPPAVHKFLLKSKPKSSPHAALLQSDSLVSLLQNSSNILYRLSVLLSSYVFVGSSQWGFVLISFASFFCHQSSLYSWLHVTDFWCLMVQRMSQAVHQVGSEPGHILPSRLQVHSHVSRQQSTLEFTHTSQIMKLFLYPWGLIYFTAFGTHYLERGSTFLLIEMKEMNPWSPLALAYLLPNVGVILQCLWNSCFHIFSFCCLE